MSPRPKVALDLEAVIEAAAEIADQFGAQEVTLANLAKRLNIRPPSLYNHVDGLPGLRKELAIFSIKVCDILSPCLFKRIKAYKVRVMNNYRFNRSFS
jgi:hypothetical protein